MLRLRLAELIAPLLVKKTRGSDAVDITGLCIDSRQAKPGDLFIALNEPEMADRHDYAADASQRGAVALLVERFLPEVDLPQVVVPHVSVAAGVVAARFYDYPAASLRMVAVTGTKGKTTTAHLIHQILTHCGMASGFIGTTAVEYGGERHDATNTTPHAVHLQALLRAMVDAGVKTVAMEVSSHSLVLHRVSGCEFDTAVFTNLGHDHLNFHEDVVAYARAKSLLFAHLGTAFHCGRKTAVVNIDDDYSELMLESSAVEAITYGRDERALLRCYDIRTGAQGTSFRLAMLGEEVAVRTPLVGLFNVYNCTAALAACLAEGIPLSQAAQALRHTKSVPGRLEPVGAGEAHFTVFVDYAHTPESLDAVLETVRGLEPNRVITVFGCGGDRDRTRRARMGKLAVEQSDLVVITSDNPRTEDPEAIIDEIEAGAREADGRYVRITDRREAIDYAISQAREGDVVLIAGKGHETYQIIGHERFPFDDRQVALEAVRRRRA